MKTPELIDDLRLLEPPQPYRLNPWLVVAVLAIIAAIWWYRRWQLATMAARNRAQAVQGAHEDALAALEKLFALIDREESRPYATESTGIVRRYIETRFELKAPRQSTEEFLAEAQSSPRLTAQQQTALAEYLRICDLLKFGRTFANRDELKNLHEAAVHFVKETRPTTTLVTA
jgi:hypothetical protein